MTPAERDQVAVTATSRRAGVVPVVGSLVLAAAVVAVFAAREQPAPPPSFEGVVSAEPAADERIVVHVGGAVHRPGLVELRAGSRVADAVLAAGGATTAANLTGLNLAASMTDGDQLIVPDAGSSAPSGSVTSSAEGSGAVDINRASAAELTSLPGVGPVLAARIVAHRESNGAFGGVADLLEVPGIGEGKLAAIRDLAVAG